MVRVACKVGMQGKVVVLWKLGVRHERQFNENPKFKERVLDTEEH